MFDDMEKGRRLAKWIISVVTTCVLVYLCFRHIASIANAISRLIELGMPLLVGGIMALILNVPMSFLETKMLSKTKLRRGKRPLAIILALLLVFGIFIGVAFLVVPELIGAIKLLIQIATNGLDQLATLEKTVISSQNPLSEFLLNLNIDWAALQLQLEEWFRAQRSDMTIQAIDTAGSILKTLVTAIIGLTFAIYILAIKETLKRQEWRLIRVWLPKQLGENIIHIASVCSSTFKLFIAGQATEAIVLGTLCMIGMVILRIPLAPMVGALVGVTALIPIVGAWIGAVIGAVMILTVNPFKAVVFVIFLLILQQVEGNAIYPRVVGSKINLPAIWVLAAITVGGNLAGTIGMLLGVPAVSAAYTLLREATSKREKQNIKLRVGGGD